MMTGASERLRVCVPGPAQPELDAERTVPMTAASPSQRSQPSWVEVMHELGRRFAPRIAAHDAADSFVAENYQELRARKVFSAGVPRELGGGGVSHSELCQMMRALGTHCSSTALALSMHTHLLALMVWRLRQGEGDPKVLREVAQDELVMVSTGASDGVESSGRAERVEGGYRVTARKIFASGSPGGALLITSAPYEDPDAGSLVLHFPVPMSAPGVSILQNWRTLGMRATGSNDVVLDGVFVPDEAISLRRPRGKWSPFFNAIAIVATPIVSAVYVGVAEATRDLALRTVAKRRDDVSVQFLAGELETELVTAQVALGSMVAAAGDYAFEPSDENASRTFSMKSIIARAVARVGEKAMELVGGGAFFRDLGIERLFRDLQAMRYHQLPEKKQLKMAGRVALGLDVLG